MTSSLTVVYAMLLVFKRVAIFSRKLQLRNRGQTVFMFVQ